MTTANLIPRRDDATALAASLGALAQSHDANTTVLEALAERIERNARLEAETFAEVRASLRQVVLVLEALTKPGTYRAPYRSEADAVRNGEMP